MATIIEIKEKLKQGNEVKVRLRNGMFGKIRNDCLMIGENNFLIDLDFYDEELKCYTYRDNLRFPDSRYDVIEMMEYKVVWTRGEGE